LIREIPNPYFFKKEKEEKLPSSFLKGMLSGNFDPFPNVSKYTSANGNAKVSNSGFIGRGSFCRTNQ
jgi:hypothetical protein